LIGQHMSPIRNSFASVGFGVGVFAVVLSYPVGAIYFVPLMALYCLGFFLTCQNRNEFWWKGGVSILLATIMLIPGVPQFVASLYAYSFSAYFFEFSPEPPATYHGSSIVFPTSHDPRGLISFVIAFVTLATAACTAKGPLRRIAVAALVCQSGIV